MGGPGSGRKKTSGGAGGLFLVVLLFAVFIFFNIGINVSFLANNWLGLKFDIGQLWTLGIIISVVAYFIIFIFIRDFSSTFLIYMIINVIVFLILLVTHFLFKLSYLRLLLKAFFNWDL